MISRHRLTIALLWAATTFGSSLQAQEYHGTTGLMQVPTAEMDSAGTFRGGAVFLHQAFLPTQMRRKNTFGYTVGLTAFRWLELSYSCSMLYMHKGGDPQAEMGYYNEDRHLNVKVMPLYEGRWWPSLAVGMDDVGRFERISTGVNGNNYFQNIYAMASKHFDLKGYELGAHIGYRYYTSDANRDRRGVAGGISLRPAFYRPLRIMGEWDGIGVNVGADVLLWRHLFVHAVLVHGRGFTGGLSYHYRLKY